MSVVTIARLSGSGGDIIAARVAERLGYTFVDSAILAAIASRVGVSMEEMMPFDEKIDSTLMEWLKSIITPQIGKIIGHENDQISPAGYIANLKTVVLGMAEKGNVVIVGRGSQYILRDTPDAFRVRIIADMETRVDWLCRYNNISREEALGRIKHSDSMRKSFIQRYFRSDWDDQYAFDLILNTTRMEIDEAVENVVAAVKTFGSRHDYIPGVRERRRTDRRKEERRKIDRRNSIVWTQRDMDSALLKEGRPLRAFSKPDRRMYERRRCGRRITDCSDGDDIR